MSVSYVNKLIEQSGLWATDTTCDHDKAVCRKAYADFLKALTPSDKVSKGLDILSSSIIVVLDYCPLISKIMECQVLTDNNLIAFNDYMTLRHSTTFNNMRFEFEDRQYVAWRVSNRGTSIINIQPSYKFVHAREAVGVHEEKLGVSISPEGKIISLWYANDIQDLGVLPEHKQLLKAALACALRNSQSVQSIEDGVAKQFSHDDLLLVRAFLTNKDHTNDNAYHVQVKEDREYSLWIGYQNSINFQPYEDYKLSRQDNKYGLKIDDEGKPVSLYHNGQSLLIQEVKEGHLPILRAAVQQLCQDANRYRFSYVGSNSIIINAVRHTLSSSSGFHIAKLAEYISSVMSKGQVARTRTNILGANLMVDPSFGGDAQDVGGLSRMYFSLLISGLLDDRDLLKVQAFEGRLPRIISKDDQVNLSDDEKELLKDLGVVMMYCSQTTETEDNMVIGRHFDDAIIKAIFYCPVGKMHAEGVLTQDEKWGLVEHLVSGDANYANIVASLNQTVNVLTDEQVNVLYYAAGADPSEWEGFAGDVDLLEGGDIPEMRRCYEIIHREAKASLLENFKNQFGVIHAIAKGCYQQCLRDQWQRNLDSVNANIDAFSDNIQGSISKERVANAIVQDQGVPELVQDKVRWLKAWVLDDTTTDKEIKDFLMWCCGSSALTFNQISVNCAGADSPYLTSHTCFGSFDIPRNQTLRPSFDPNEQGGFIASLKESIQMCNIGS